MRTVELTEWSLRFERRQEDPEPPTHCPVCGRALVRDAWETVGHDGYYPLLVCWGNWPWWRLWIQRRLGMAFNRGTHFRYTFSFVAYGVDDLALMPYDPWTGEPQG